MSRLTAQTTVLVLIVLATVAVLVIGYIFIAHPYTTANRDLASSTVVPYLRGLPQNIAASCVYYNSTRIVLCMGRGDNYTANWFISAPGSNQTVNASSFGISYRLPVYCTYADCQNGGQMWVPSTLIISVNQRQEGAYVPGAYCVKAYNLNPNNITLTSC